VSDSSGEHRWRTWLRGWGFSSYERRALWFLIVLLLVGSSVRFYHHRRLSKRLELWVETADTTAAREQPPVAEQPSIDYPLDLNLATATELEMLPGIGTKRAADIEDFRRTHGPFGSVDELDLVYGIGLKTIERLRPLVTVGGHHKASGNSAELGSPDLDISPPVSGGE